MVTVKIYTTPTCPWCQKAKEYFKSHRVGAIELDVTEDDKAAREMVQISGQMAVPVIVIDEKVIVGFNQPEIEKILAKAKEDKKAKKAE